MPSPPKPERRGTRMAKSHNTAVLEEPPAFERVEVKKLVRDAKNPRLAEYALGDRPTQSELLKLLWQKMAVDGLALSIAARGYFPHEPLFVAEEEGRLVGIEGNRRLAAVSILLDAELRKRLKNH